MWKGLFLISCYRLDKNCCLLNVHVHVYVWVQLLCSVMYKFSVHGRVNCLTFDPAIVATYDEDDDEISPDLWQEACWIVIRLASPWSPALHHSLTLLLHGHVPFTCTYAHILSST